MLPLPLFIRRTPMGIAQKIGLVFVALFLIAVVNVVLVERMMTRSDTVADTVNVAGKLRMLGMRIALQTVGYGHGVGAGSVEIRQLMNDFEEALKALARGGHVFGLQLQPLGQVHDHRLQTVHDQWSVYQGSILRLLDEIILRSPEGGVDSPVLEHSFIGLHSHLEAVSAESAKLLWRTESLVDGILQDVQRAQGNTMGRLYWLIAIDALLILLAFMAVRRQIVVPLRDLSTHCMELANGNYNTRFQASTQDEIGHLAKVFNESAGRIGTLV